MVVQKKVPLLRWTMMILIKALNYLQEHFNVIHSYKQNGEILIKAERDYRTLLKALAHTSYPKYIETRKIRFEIRTLILIKEVTIR